MKGRYIWLMIASVLVVGATVAGVSLWEYHEQPDFCGAACHLMDPYLASYHGHGADLLANTHADEGITCLDCHEPTMEQQVQELVTYVKGDYRQPLKERKFDNEWCFRCKEHGSYEELVERTKDYSETLTADGEAVNPHNPQVGMENAEDELPCYSCHKVHQESLLLDYCYVTCHMSGVIESCSRPGCHEE